VQLPRDEIFTTLLATELNAARPRARYRVLNRERRRHHA